MGTLATSDIPAAIGLVRNQQETGMRCNRSKTAVLSGWMSLLLLSACVSTEPRELVPTISQSPEQIVLAGDGGASEPEVDFGLTATV
ncbi:MAG TPA: hypothetical protein DEG76_09230, partial [Pseudohongiella sp.]|nr:hypothetical protein [Pseudohongiella sp.]